MMRWIIRSSLRLRLVVATLAALLMVFGFTQLRKMPVDALPEFSRPYVELQIEALGLSAQEVEALITTPMEADMLNGTPWAEEIRSMLLVKSWGKGRLEAGLRRQTQTEPIEETSL